MSESSPVGNVIHMGLTEGSKADPVCEMAEYFSEASLLSGNEI